jgi:hypothetical protein
MRARRSSSHRGGLRALLCVVPVIGLGGCIDYMKHSDTVSLNAGETQAWNKVVHTTDPWPPYVMDTRISGDGRRTAAVIQRYSTGSQEADLAQASAATPGSGADKPAQ